MQESGEVLGKGVSFFSEEGVHNLTDTLCSIGYGNTKNIISAIKDREDFRHSLNVVLGKESEFYDESAGDMEEFYDPRVMLLDDDASDN